ncbi:hypothetical protein AAHA92_02908 [Salvia divinorum]|uniref:Uncharacterized protein n=1 Tax=Salvia divinorum TaxID=28513 RepID=A0ABD1IIP4_SALDI
MDQIQKKTEEERVMAANRVAEINKKWAAKKPKDEANTFGMKNEDCARSGGPLDTTQWAAGNEAESATESHLA